MQSENTAAVHGHRVQIDHTPDHTLEYGGLCQLEAIRCSCRQVVTCTAAEDEE